jgi:hypothetical protein
LANGEVTTREKSESSHDKDCGHGRGIRWKLTYAKRLMRSDFQTDFGRSIAVRALNVRNESFGRNQLDGGRRWRRTKTLHRHRRME